MISLRRLDHRTVVRAVAVVVAVAFVLSALSLAYAAGRHAHRSELSPDGRAPATRLL